MAMGVGATLRTYTPEVTRRSWRRVTSELPHLPAKALAGDKATDRLSAARSGNAFGSAGSLQSFLSLAKNGTVEKEGNDGLSWKNC